MPTRNDVTITAWWLWVGFAGGAVAWLALGAYETIVAWRFCPKQADFGVAGAPGAATPLLFLPGLLLVAATFAAGIISYRNWRALVGQRSHRDAPARERREFMALAGVLAGVTCGVGAVWMVLPPLLLNLCWRAH